MGGRSTNYATKTDLNRVLRMVLVYDDDGYRTTTVMGERRLWESDNDNDNDSNSY
jgi:hypothetical protein